MSRDLGFLALNQCLYSIGDESAIAFIALKYLGDLLPHSFDTKQRSELK